MLKIKKTTLLTLSLVASAVTAFAQGKVSLALDLPIVMGSPPWALLPGDNGLAGQFLPTTGPLPSGVILQIGLYGGTSSGALSLISSETINPVGGSGFPPGTFPQLHIILPFAGGSFDFFQVKIWDHAYASFEAQLLAVGGRDYLTENNIFSMIPGTGISYPQVYNGGSTTWTTVGNETSFIIGIFPEPSTLALAGLGAAMLLFYRRQK